MRTVATGATKMTVKELTQSLVKVTVACKQDIAQWKGDPNPQVVAVLQKAKGRLELAEAILDAIDGRPGDLKTFME